jgi:hypothetical protein
MLLGMGLFTTIGVHTPLGVLAVFQIIQGLGMGLLYCTYVRPSPSPFLSPVLRTTQPLTHPAQFPVLAPLPLSASPSAVALVTFVRAFAQAWGVAVSGTILQNRLLALLPPAVLALVPPAGRAELAYAVVPRIAALPPAVRAQTQAAFAHALGTVWRVMLVLCAVGMGTVGAMREVPLRKTTDRRWGLKEKTGEGDEEKAQVQEGEKKGEEEKSAGGEGEVQAVSELPSRSEEGALVEERREVRTSS